jgi:hypothetical protein
MKEEKFHILPGTIKNTYFPGTRASGGNVIPTSCVRISAILLLMFGFSLFTGHEGPWGE